MKKLFISAAFVACFALQKGNAQTVNGVKLSELQSEYLEVSSEGRLFSDKVYITLEYGQDNSSDKNLYVKADDGKNIEFNSVLDFVNYMKDYNYELFQVYTVNTSRNITDKRYILKRKK